MPKEIYVNLPVKDLKESIKFFSKIGYDAHPQFTSTDAACIVVSNEIYVMLLTHEKFKSFSPNKICDTSKSNEVIVCVSCESKKEVDETVERAIIAGATKNKEPRNYGFLYNHGFYDLDGHIWEFVYMDQSFVKRGN